MENVDWRKSTRSGGNGENCVEVAALPDVIAVRDGKNPDGGMLTFGPERREAFVKLVRNGFYRITI